MSKDLKSVKSATPKPMRSEKAIASAYVTQARKQYATSTSDLEIDDEPQVSISENGAWIAAWVWVAQEETSLFRKRRARTAII